MLRIFTGENRDAKLLSLTEHIKSDINSGTEVIALVPDQYSFAFDKKLYQALGPKDFNKITVTGFKRLCTRLVSEYGSDRGVLIDPNSRLALIYIAIQNVKKSGELSVLSRSLDKPNFILDMSSLFDSMKHSGVTPDMLMDASTKINGTLGDKLHDVSLLLKGYNDELDKINLRDESSLIFEGAKIAYEHNVFNCKAVYLDRFDTFPMDEFELVKAALRDAKSLNISLLMPNADNKGFSDPYGLTRATARRLADTAKEFNISAEFISNHTPDSAKESVKAVKEYFFTRPNSNITPDDSVKIYSADTLYAEADFVAASVRDCIAKGYTYSDITVCTHDIKTYGRILKSSFEKYGVPCFIDKTEPASDISLIVYALSALEAASSRKLSTEKILNLVRSPLSALTEDEVSCLEDYCLRWNVDANMWTCDFTASEQGFDLEAINAARKKVIEPLVKFREKITNATAPEISSAFSQYLKDTCLVESVVGLIDSLDGDEKLELSRLFKRLWHSLSEAMSSVSNVLGDEKISPATYRELIRIILSQSNLATPPQKLDCVTVADVSRSVISTSKIVFVVGVNDTKFPADVKQNGLFNGKDIGVLDEMGISFEPTLEFKLSAERLDCHKALLAAEELLVFTYSYTDVKGAALRPSPYIQKVSRLVGATPMKVSDLPEEFYSSYPNAAYMRLAASENMSDAEYASVREALITLPEYREKLYRLSLVKANAEHKLSPEVAEKLFSWGDVNVTPSRIDVYNRCNFEYFCKYGLGISDVRPVNMDPNVRGTVMHYVFETVLNHFGDGFENVTDDELYSLIDATLESYSQNELGGSFGKSAKFLADYSRLKTACFEILKNIRAEYAVSKFRPARFEYDLKSSDGGSVLSILINENMRINIRGVVDRVDMYTDDNGTRYIRILDYKTGEKKLSYADVYHGLNLQMLLYMVALVEGTDRDFADCKPAGIVYMHAGFLQCDDDYDPLAPDAKDRLKSVNKQLQRDGLIVDNPEAVSAMDSTLSGVYVPVKIKKDGTYSASSKIISEHGFAILQQFAKDKVVRFGADLLDGKISALPLGYDEKDIDCRFCEFSSVCDRKKYMMKVISREDRQKLLEQIGEVDTNAQLD